MKLMFEIKNQKLERTDDSYPVSMSQNYLLAKFKFKTKDWDNRRKIVIFSNFNGAYKLELTEENDYTVLVPYKVLEGHKFRVSVYSCGNIRITTNYEIINLIEGGYCQKSSEIGEPEGDLVCDILSRLDTKVDKIETDQEGNIMFYAGDKLLSTLPIKQYVTEILEGMQFVKSVYWSDDDLNVEYINIEGD